MDGVSCSRRERPSKRVCLRAWRVNAPGPLGRRLLHCAQIGYPNSQVPDEQESPHRGWSCSARPLQVFHAARAPNCGTPPTRAPQHRGKHPHSRTAPPRHGCAPDYRGSTPSQEPTASCFCAGVRDDLWAGESVTSEVLPNECHRTDLLSKCRRRSTRVARSS